MDNPDVHPALGYRQLHPFHLPRSDQSQLMAVQLGVAHHPDLAAHLAVTPTRPTQNPEALFCLDEDFSPFFIKFSTYFPYTAKLCINGNECAKRQAAKTGIGFEALDNGFAAVDDVDRLQAICDRLGPEQIDALLRKWLRVLPTPFTNDDEAAGYRYELSILQAEFSLTQMLDAPVSGGSSSSRSSATTSTSTARPRRADLRPPHPARPQTHQGGPAVPGGPAPYLVLIESGESFGGLDGFLDAPALSGDGDQGVQGGRAGCVAAPRSRPTSNSGARGCRRWAQCFCQARLGNFAGSRSTRVLPAWVGTDRLAAMAST